MDGINYGQPPEGDEPQPRAGARWETVQHLFTTTSGSAPPQNLLLAGELGLELADPVKIWAGVPTSMDVTGRKLLYDSSKSVGAAFPEAPTDGAVYGRQGSTASWLSVLPTTGGTLTGALHIDSVIDASITLSGPGRPSVTFNTTVNTAAAGYLQASRYGLPRWAIEFANADAETGFNSGTNFAIQRFNDSGNQLAPTPLSIARSDGTVTIGAALLLSGDPTAPLGAATRQYVDSHVGNYLPLSGGVLTGGLGFGQSVVTTTTDLTRHISLHTSGYGFGITANRLNYNAPGNATHWFIVGGADIVRVTFAGLTMGLNVDLQLDHDPTSPLHAATKRYVDNAATNITGSYLALAGGTMSGAITLVAGYPSQPLHATHKTYVDDMDALRLLLTGGILTGFLTLSGNATGSLHAVPLQQLNSTVAGYLPLTGGTLTNYLTLSGAPVNNLHAATKAYVDNAVQSVPSNYLPLSGGTLTGRVQSNSPFTINFNSASNGYPAFGFWDTNTANGYGFFSYTATIMAISRISAGGGAISPGVQFDTGAQTITVPGGIKLGTVNSTTASVVGGVEMYPTFGGFGVSANTLNYNWAGTHQFAQGNTLIMNISGAQLTMQSPLVLAADPTTALQAATKQYVDSKAGAYLPLVGGNLTGPLTINATGFTWTGAVSGDQPRETIVWTGAGSIVGTFIVAAGGAQPAIVGVAAQGSMSSPVQPLYTQTLLQLAGRGWDGAAWTANQAVIHIKTNEQWSTTGHGTHVLFETTPRGGLTRTGYMVFNGAGNLLIGTNDPGQDNLTDRLQVFGSATFVGAVTLQTTPTAASHATTKQYVDSKVGAYLPLTAGINFPLTDELYLDGTGTGKGATLHLTTAGWPAVVWNTMSTTGAAGYFQSQRNSLNRWAVEFGGTAAETGGNVGTDFLINRFADNGNVIYPSPLQIIRGTGVINIGTPLMLAGDPTANLQAATKQYVDGKAGNYLPLGGGTMTGGIVFANVYGQSTADATHHLILYSGFGFGVTANRMNYIAGAAGSHVFLNGVDTVAISSTGLAMQGSTDITLARDPTSNMHAVTKQYSDKHLLLAGGTMTGGIIFSNVMAPGPANTFSHITLWSGPAYGLSVTGGRLNLVTGGGVWFTVSGSGQDIANFDANGLNMVGLTTVSLGKDPTSNLHAATKQYVDGILTAAGGPFLPISAGPTKALTGDLYLLTRAPTINEQATNKLYVDTADQYLQSQISAVVSGNLVFYGQLSVPNDSVHYKSTLGLPDGPLPLPTAFPKGGYVIVTTGGVPPATGTNIPALPPGTPQYVRGDWFITDGQIWVFLPTGLVYFTADAVTVSPPIQGNTNVQTTLAWLNTNKLNLAGGTMTGTLALYSDPTSNMMAATKQYVDTKAFLPLAGGTMTGGISFGSQAMVSNSDTSRHITLHAAGFGFGITPGRLNYNVGGPNSHYFMVGGIDIAWINSSGMGMSAPLYLSGDPTTATMAATKQYVDGRTPLTTDAPNNTFWYGRHTGAWALIPGWTGVGAGAFDLNSIPNGQAGIYTITNQTSAANWPTDNPDQTGFLLQGYNSNGAWQTQLMMGGRQRGIQPALWYRSFDDGFPGNNNWSPWNRIIGSTGGTFTGAVTHNAAVYFANSQFFQMKDTVGTGFQFNVQADNNLVFHGTTSTGADRILAAIYMRQDASAWSFVTPMSFGSTVTLALDPTTALQAATKQYVDNSITGKYLLLTGGTLTGNLTVNTQVWVGTGTGTGGAILVVQAAATKSPGLSFFTAFQRWFIALDAVAEGGSNAGGNLQFYRYADNGTFLGTAFSFNRADGSATFGYKVFLANDPTSALEAATKGYVDNKAAAGVTSFNTRTGAVTLTNADVIAVLPGSSTLPAMDGTAAIGTGTTWARADHVHASDTSRLALTGGTMSGGLSFGNGLAGAPTDLTRHIALWTPNYGFSITGGTLNIVAGGTVALYPASATLVATFTSGGLTMSSGYITLAADPTTAMQAVTKQYVDAKQPSYTRIGTDQAFDLNTISGSGAGPYTNYQGFYSIVNQTAGVNFPPGVVTTAVLNLWTSNGGWAEQMAFAGGPWTRWMTAQGSYNAWTKVMLSSGATMTGGLSLGAALSSSATNLSRHLMLYDGGAANQFGLNVWFDGTNAMLNYVVTEATHTYHRFIVGAVTVASIGSAGLTMLGTAAITLAGDPTSALQATTKQYVDSKVGGSGYLPTAGGTMTGDLTISAARNLNFQAVTTNTGQMHSDANWGIIIQGLAGSVADVALFSRSGSPQLRILSNGTVNINGATVDTAGTMLLVADPTAALGAATKQYVDTKSGGGVLSFNTRTGAVTLSNADVIAVLPGSNTTPVMDGVAAIGVSTRWALADHVHASDTTRVAKVGDTMTGMLTISPSATGVPALAVGGNWNSIYAANVFGAYFGFNYSGGQGELSIVNAYATAAQSFRWYQQTGAAAQTLLATMLPTGVFTPVGLAFANLAAPGGVQDFSKHIQLWSGTNGINITAGRQNYVAAAGNTQVFVQGAVDVVSIGTTGLSMLGATDIFLARDPTTAFQATTKQYVDNKIAGQGPFLPVAGGTLTGGLSLPWLVATGNTAAYSSQGAYIMWNRSGGGITNFVNNQGLGSGGFTFTNTTTAMVDTLLLAITPNAATFSVDAVFAGPNPALTISGAAGTWRTLEFATGATVAGNRWQIQVDTTAEGGSNAGSNLVINRFSDTGTSLSPFFSANRATGLLTLSFGLSFGNQVGASATDLSKHISLYGGNAYGFSITNATLNLVSNGALSATFLNTGIAMPAATDITLARDPTAALMAVTKQYCDNKFALAVGGGYVAKSGDVMTGNLTLPSATLSTQPYPNVQFVSTGNAADAKRAQIYIDTDGSYNVQFLNDAQTVGGRFLQVTRSGATPGTTTITGALTVTGACNFGDIYGNVNVNTGALYLRNNLGIYYNTAGGNWVGFGWDGSWLTCYVNGGYQYQIISPAWVSNNFKAIGAYTPNQVVDYNVNPTFNQLTANYGVRYPSFSLNYMAFGWNGRVQCWVDGGGAYVELRDTRDYTPNQGVDVGSEPTFNGTHIGNLGMLGNGLGWWMKFNWDGQNVPSYANGNYACTLVSSGWVDANYQPRGGYGNASYNTNAGWGWWYSWGGGQLALYWNGTFCYHSTDGSGPVYPFANALSDANAKYDIAPTKLDCLAIINAMPLFEFRWRPFIARGRADWRAPRDDREPLVRVGIVAQEQIKVFPESIKGGADGGWGTDHNVLIAALAGAVQQLTEQNAALMARVEVLETRTLH